MGRCPNRWDNEAKIRLLLGQLTNYFFLYLLVGNHNLRWLISLNLVCRRYAYPNSAD